MENLWSGPPSVGFAKTADPASSRSIAFVDITSAPFAAPLGVQWSPMTSVVNTPSKSVLQLSDSRTAVDMYFGVFESISKSTIGESRPGARTMTQPMR